MKSAQPDNPMSASPVSVKFEKDVVALVETNVDDTTGEILGRTLERLMAEGAFDATITAFTGKKGRTGQTVRVICHETSVQKFAEILVEETGTLGVKILQCTRLIVPRKQISFPLVIRNYEGNVSAKIAWIGGSARIKPEVSEAQKISDELKIPLRDVLEKITDGARKHLESETKFLLRDEEGNQF